MRKLVLTQFCACFAALSNAPAQCIDDIYYLIDSPKPCFFVGSVSSASPDCFDLLAYPTWQYTWVIKNAKTGEVVATYPGMAFAHQFEKFGGYDFCLEIDKDGDPTNAPDWVECQTYTTCEICSEDEISFEYKDCSSGSGCKVELKANIDAANAEGVLPLAKYIVTYIPTPQEGPDSYELEFKDIAVQYNPATGLIQISEVITVPYVRGCYQPRLVFELDYGAGGHYISGGEACDMVELQGEKVFRCIACNNEAGECMNSIYATKIANETGKCDPHACVLGRSGESEEETTQVFEPFQVYPNPANEYLILSSSELREGDYTVLLFNPLGRVELTESWPRSLPEKKLNLKNQVPGIYHLAVFEAGHKVFSERIVLLK